MSKLRTITVTLKEESGKKVVTVAPDKLEVERGDRVEVKIEGSNDPLLLGVEVHVPGNQARELMFQGSSQSPRRADVIFDKKPFAFRIGRNAGKELHPYCVYAHFKGSTVTVEGRTSKNVGPTMIVE